MSSASTLPMEPGGAQPPWTQPYRGTVGMACLIIAESAIFLIFIVAYIFYLGKSLSGPTPQQVLELPIFGTVCLLSSSITVHMAVVKLRQVKLRAFTFWLAATVILGAIFLFTTGQEWYRLIYEKGLTLQTNLFGTTYYSLVGLHASHVIVGLILLSFTLLFALSGRVNEHHFEKFDTLSLYWHFVDGVWVVVFTVVYIVGR